jgi:protein-S-isoprenylcysteine O-methyltransferase Ste14
MPFEDFARAFLACYFAFVAVFYTAKLMALRLRTGHSHADAGPPATPQSFSHKIFRLFRGLILAVCVVRVVFPSTDALLIPIMPLQMAPLIAAGMVMLVASLGLIVYTHSYMNEEWRSGVGANPQVLLTGGPFALTRNPMFMSIMLGQLGFFFALPSLFTLFCFAIGVLVVWGQATYEEERLRDAFGDRYAAYAAAVPRWLPLPWSRARRAAGA